MTSFKSKLSALCLCLFAFDAAAQDSVYTVPPVTLFPLKKMETNSYGLTVAEENDFLNENVWKNATYSSIADKISRLPASLPAKAEELRLTLLKLTAEAPQGSEDQSFITLRLQELFNRGQFEDVYELMQKIPEHRRTEKQNKIYADVLLTRDLKKACALADRINNDQFEQEFSAVCAALNQDSDKAFLSLDLLTEEGKTDLFVKNAVEHFLYQKPLTERKRKQTPLSAAVWRQCGLDLTELLRTNSPIWFNAMIVRDGTVPVDIRLSVAEKLVQKGLYPPTKLRDLYQRASVEENKNKKQTEALKRANAVQQAAALSDSLQDNLKKQAFIRQGMASAEKDGVSYAFSAAVKDILETLKPDIDTLGTSSDIIKAFNLAGLHKQVQDWQLKAEILFPASETTANGWYFTELSKTEKKSHLFLPSLEQMTSYEEKNKRVDKKFTAKIDRLMLTFKTLQMIQPDEKWKYTSFAKGSAEDRLARRKPAPLSDNISAGENVLDALNEINGSYGGLLKALSLLTQAGLEREAADVAAQSIALILNPASGNE